MVKKHLNPLEDPPTASSSDEDEVGTSEGEGEEEEVSSSGEEEEEDSPDPVKPSPAAASVTIAVPGKPTATASKQEESDSDSGSETETDSDSESPGSGKPLAVTTPVAAAAAKPPKQKETHAQAPQPSAALALPAVKSGTKRPSEGTSTNNNAKRAKKDEEKKTGGDETKKPSFQRKWFEEDEIALLQGMIDFKSDTGKSPYEDTNAFYEFIKESISFEVSKNQFMDKIRSLKKKYMVKEKTGVEPSFTKAHEKRSYDLSKNIWGPEGFALETSAKSNGVSKKSQSQSKSANKKIDSVKQELVFPNPPNGKKPEEDNKIVVGGGLESVKESGDWFEKSFIVKSISGFGLDEYTVKQQWSLVAEESKKKIEEKLKALQAKEIEFALQKTEFLHQVTSLIAEASKNKKTN